MKKQIWFRNFFAAIIIVAISSLAFTSCEQDLEEFTEEEEFEGDVRDRFVGDWTVKEKSNLLGERNYIVSISKDSNYRAQVNIENFYLLPDSEVVAANISSVLVNTMTIPNQTLPSAHFAGGGELIDELRIELEYFVDDGNDVDTVTAVYIR